MSNETTNKTTSTIPTSKSYTDALHTLKAYLADPTPFAEQPNFKGVMECIYESLYMYYGEKNISAYTPIGKQAREYQDELVQKMEAMPELQQCHDGIPLYQIITEDTNFVMGRFEEAALIEGVKIGMRIMLEGMAQ